MNPQGDSYTADAGTTDIYVGRFAPSMVHFPGATWDTRTDGEAGLSTAALDSLIATVGGSGVITRDGYLVRTWGSYTSSFDWASASKPMLTALLALLVEESAIASVDATLHSASLGWSFTAADQAMTWRHLANNVSGYGLNEDPGQSWAYNDHAIELYRESLELVAGASLNAALTSRLSALQFQDGAIANASGRVILSPRDYARVGWWFCNAFNWSGSQLVAASLHADLIESQQVANTVPVSTGTMSDYLGVGTYGGASPELVDYGYGYRANTWHNGGTRSSDGARLWPDAPTDMYIFDGHGGTETVVIQPTQGIVAAWVRASAFGIDFGNPASAQDNAFAQLAGAVI